MSPFNSFKLPKTWMLVLPYLAICAWTLYFSSGEDWRYRVVTSDGRGYYAYLPALFIYDDPSFQKVLEVERNAYEHGIGQAYVFQNEEGKNYNKYYPGVALLQTPFFVMGLFTSNVLGQPVTGYSDASLLAVILAGLTYGLLGFYMFLRVLSSFGIRAREALLSTLLIYFGSHVFYQVLALPSFSHNYSFFLFAVFMCCVAKILRQPKKRYFFLFGIVFGILVLVRPTNGIILFFVPFLVGSKEGLVQFIRNVFSFQKGYLLSGLMGAIPVLCLLPILWKWQVGSWILWSYHGEGFNFLEPRIWETLWSYRIGIFVHTPVTLLAFFGLTFLYKESRYQFWSWLGYFSLLVYIISSWWCWDYESNLGHRAFSEHMAIFAFPLALFLSRLNVKLVLTVAILLIGYSSMRAYQRVSGIFPVQRFSPLTYWRSVGDFDQSVQNKYYWLEHCPPFGKVFDQTELQFPEQTFTLSPDRHFSEGVQYQFPLERFRNRFFVEVQFEKQLLKSDEDWRDVLLVFDATNETTGERHYFASPVHSYYKEGLNEWHFTIVQDEIPVEFNPMEKLVVYFWNMGQKTISIQHVKVIVKEFTVN